MRTSLIRNISVLAACLAIYVVAPASAADLQVYSTGVNSNKTLATEGTTDSHWTVGGSSAYVSNTFGGGWVGNTTASQWISPTANGNGSYPSQTYQYIQTFNIGSGLDLSSVAISGQFSVDDWTTVKVNGVQVANFPAGTWSSWASFALNSSDSTFVTGTNTIEFDVNNSGGGASGLQVDIISARANGIANTPEPGSLAMLGAMLAGGGFYRLRRRRTIPRA